MQQINLALTDKEMQVVALMAPGKTPEAILNVVIRDWFNANMDRMYKQIKSQNEVLDEIIAVAESAVIKAVVEPPAPAPVEETPPAEATPAADNATPPGA